MQKRISMVNEPNVVPMIDVLLVLLIIFMLVSVESLRRAFDIVLPQPETPGAPGAAPIVLTISPGPQYEVNGQHLAPDRLESELQAIFAGRKERILFVKGDRAMRYQEVVQAFDAARGAGVSVTAIVPESAR